MMGRQDDGQGQFLYHFDLEELVPDDHLLRGIDRFLDLAAWRTQLEPYYSHTGRPSIDPELMIRMLLIGYCYGIRSERRLCEEVKLNLAYRWFCRLSIDAKVPDHSTFSKTRHGRFRDSDALRLLFEQTVDRCIDEDLVSGEGFAIDASVVRADANTAHVITRDDDEQWPRPGGTSRAVREYLAALDDGTQPSKRVSTTDPATQWTAAPGGPAFFAYSTNYLIDVDAGIIVDVEATKANRTDEVESTKTMVDRVESRFDLTPKRLIGDTAYGSANLLEWMVNQKGIEPHVPVWDKGERKDGTFSRSDFEYIASEDIYRCPGGKELRRFRRNYRKPRKGISKAEHLKYGSSKHDCDQCPLKQQCCPNSTVRRLSRHVHEAARDVARGLRDTPRYLQSRKDRKKVEMLFGHMKRILHLDRLRLRGLKSAGDEFLLAATAQNLRRLAQWLGQSAPQHRIGAPV